MDRATFWATKSPLPEFHAVVFEHPAFSDVFRLVGNVFEPVTLGGSVHQPAPMTIQPPEQTSDATPAMTLNFPRAALGRQFKAELRRVVAAGSRDPIRVTYAVYLGDTSAPQVAWGLYVSDKGGISFNAEAVTVKATLDNPMRRAVAPIYDPAVFTGLEIL